MRQIIIWGYSMWNSLKTTAKENIKDFFKVNGAAAGSVGASELGWLDWMGMPELIQSWVVTGTVIIIFLYNAGKAVQLYRQITWEKEDRRNGQKS